MHTSHHIRRIKKRLRMCSQKHKEAHRRHRWSIYHPRNSGPDENISKEPLNRTRSVDHPWSGKGTTGVKGSDGGVKKAGNYAGVGADVFENRNSIEGGLIVGLGGLESGRIYAKGVGSATDALNPDSKDGCNPFVGHKVRRVHGGRWWWVSFVGVFVGGRRM